MSTTEASFSYIVYVIFVCCLICVYYRQKWLRISHDKEVHIENNECSFITHKIMNIAIMNTKYNYKSIK